jgi:GntR family transcriptional regulator/MocR family aminotransferase
LTHELLIRIDKRLDTSLSRQIYEQILQSITNRCLRIGDPIPSTRLLAEQIQVSRSVFLQAYEQLHAEGFLEMRKGAGTFIAAIMQFPMISDLVFLLGMHSRWTVGRGP